MIFQNIIYKNFFLNSLILLIPASYIAGNLVFNLNIVILILSILFFFGRDIFKVKFNRTDIIVLLIFGYIFLNGIYNQFFNFSFPEPKFSHNVLVKSIFYFRFFILYFGLKFLIKKNIINFKYLFYVYSLCALFVCVDLIFQYKFGVDFFGYEGNNRRLSGPFGDELIAGSYVQRFFIFSLFSIILFANFKNKLSNSLLILLILILSSVAILISGNRMPFLLFILMLFLTFFYSKKIRIILIMLTVLITIFFSYLVKFDQKFYYHYSGFEEKSLQIIIYLKDKVSGNPITTTNSYIKELELGLLTWKINKYFGGGIKSFYWNCISMDAQGFGGSNKANCNSHPHNYYLQILAELGIVGLFLTILLFLSIIFKSIKKIHFGENIQNERNIIVPFFIIFLVEIFPLKTTGSFFTSINASFLFIIIAFIAGLSEYKKTK